jgi:hypothetical protein
MPNYQYSITVSVKPIVKDYFHSGAFFLCCFLQKYCGWLKECRKFSRAEWQRVTETELQEHNQANKYVGLTSVQTEIGLQEFYLELHISRSSRHKDALCGHHVCLSVRHPSVALSPNSAEEFFTKPLPVMWVSWKSAHGQSHFAGGRKWMFSPRFSFLGRFRSNSVQQIST